MIAKLERRVIAASLLEGRVPDVDLDVGDFTDETHRAIYAAMTAVAAPEQELSTVAVWRHDPSLDPIELCQLLSDFATDEGAHCRDLHLIFWADTRGVPWPAIIAQALELCRSRSARLLVVDTLGSSPGWLPIPKITPALPTKRWPHCRR